MQLGFQGDFLSEALRQDSRYYSDGGLGLSLGAPLNGPLFFISLCLHCALLFPRFPRLKLAPPSRLFESFRLSRASLLILCVQRFSDSWS